MKDDTSTRTPDGDSPNEFESGMSGAVADLRLSQVALSEELRNAHTLHDLGARLVSEGDIQTIYEEILTAAIEIADACAGTVQMLDSETEELVILATRGFGRETNDYFRRVDAASNTSCGAALRSGTRSYSDFDPASTDKSARLHVADGVLSAQSTPLLSRSGKPIGMVSTHWGELGRRLTERELRFLDLLARQAADLLEQRASDEALRDSERHAQLLLAELQHRVRNTLAVVRSIARRTAENSKSVDDMLGHFQGRLNAFSRVQAALTRNPAATIDLVSLIEDELAAHGARDGEQINFEGPKVLLKAKSAEHLSLAIHELTTNAVKHGALIGDKGKVHVRWKTELLNGGEDLLLSWTESGVKLDGKTPTREGFGMELLQRSLPYNLHAKTEFEFRPEGLHFELRMPLNADN